MKIYNKRKYICTCLRSDVEHVEAFNLNKLEDQNLIASELTTGQWLNTLFTLETEGENGSWASFETLSWLINYSFHNQYLWRTLKHTIDLFGQADESNYVSSTRTKPTDGLMATEQERNSKNV